MIHLQVPVNDWLQAVQRLPAGAVVKAVDNVQALDEAKRTNPAIRTCLRHWYDTGQVFGGTWQDNLNRARAFLASFVDGTFTLFAANVDYIEEFNEYLASSHTGAELAQRVMWAEAVANVWKNEYRTLAAYSHIRLVLCNTAVGNNIDRQFAEIADHYDCVMGYHAYDHWVNGVRDPGSWQYHSGRWTTMDADYTAHGLVVDWIFTEAGPYEGVVTGWRHSACLGGDVTRYVAAMRQWIREVMATPAGRQGRTLGACLFTTGGGDWWQHFETRQPELNQLADMWAQEWRPGTQPPPPPPDPDPEPTMLKSFEDGWTDLSGRIQQPNGFTVHVTPPGSQMWYGEFIATGTVEAKHLSVNQLPPEDHDLILDGDWVYKIQAVGMASGTELRTVFEGDGQYWIEVPIQCHYQAPDVYGRVPPLEADDIYAVLLVNGQEEDRWQFPELPDRTYVSLMAVANLPAVVTLRVQTSYANSRDIFTDAWEIRPFNPAPQPCRGEPRVQYARRYNVIPASATEQQAIDIFLTGWRESRQTAGGSYDDAGVGNLDQRLAVLWDIPQDRRPEFMTWYATHYPGVDVQFRDLPPDFRLTHWPTISRYITQAFGARPEYYGQFGLPGHEGVDIAAPQDTTIKAAAPGRVIVAGNHDNYGWHVRLEHDGGRYHTIYAHLGEALNVTVGQDVPGGYRLGASGNTGNSSGYHLHFGMKQFPDGLTGWPYNIIDPTPYLNQL